MMSILREEIVAYSDAEFHKKYYEFDPSHYENYKFECFECWQQGIPSKARFFVVVTDCKIVYLCFEHLRDFITLKALE